MNSINHAATALVVKRFAPGVPFVPLLISVQLIEFIWVGLNLIGVERTQFDADATTIADMHLVHMPFSHSIAFTMLWAAIAWIVVAAMWKQPKWGFAIAVGIMSHIILDALIHVPDVEIIPFLGWPELGTGIYGIPLLAFAVELAYGVFVWWIARGNMTMLIGLCLLNLSSISFYVTAIAGPEVMLAGRPDWLAMFIGGHIVIGLAAVYWIYTRQDNLDPMAAQ
ncbi:MAG: metal-dependent hydrolase [Alphaproteobacteria bacterium]